MKDGALWTRRLAGAAAVFAKLCLLMVLAALVPGRHEWIGQPLRAAAVGLGVVGALLLAVWCRRRLARGRNGD